MGIIIDMDVIYGVIAAVIGVAMGWAQFKMLQGIIAKQKMWFVAVKLSAWLLCMLVAFWVSVVALISFIVASTASLIVFGFVHMRKQQKAGQPTDGRSNPS